MSLPHQHLLQLIAVDFDPLANQYSMISEMMFNGDIKKYISNNPATLNRLCLVRDRLRRATGVEFTSFQLHDAAMGLHYLHERDVVHGDLKGVRPPVINVFPHARRFHSIIS